MRTTIAIAQHKGGVGKTTSCLSTGEALSRMGKRVLLVDLDVQANLTFSLVGKFEGKGVLSYLESKGKMDPSQIIYESKKENLYIIPNEKRVRGEIVAIDDLLGSGFPSLVRIEKLLNHPVTQDFDYILFDLPPSKDKIVANTMMAVDFYIIPVDASDYCLEGIDELINFCEETKEYNTSLALLGIYMPNVDLRLKANKSLIKELENELGDMFIKARIPTNAKIGTLPSQGKTVFDLKGSSSKGKKEYEELAREIESRIVLSRSNQP